MKKKKNRVQLSKPLFLCIFIIFIASLVFSILYTYNNIWTYKDYRIKRIYDNEIECLDVHSKDYCLDKDKVIIRDSK